MIGWALPRPGRDASLGASLCHRRRQLPRRGWRGHRIYWLPNAAGECAANTGERALKLLNGRRHCAVEEPDETSSADTRPHV
jgi:hypothetical protein